MRYNDLREFRQIECILNFDYNKQE